MSSRNDRKLAAQWAKTGLERGRNFVSSPANYHRLLDENYLFSDHHNPYHQAPISIDIPKNSNADSFRNVSLFSAEDETMFIWAAKKNLPAITKKISELGYKSDYANPIISNDLRSDEWINNFINPYRNFRKKQNKLLSQGFDILEMDIKSFGPSVNPRILRNTLIDYCGGDTKATDQFINHIARLNKQGILQGLPIGSVSSDIFLKAYLLPFDEIMLNEYGANYFRYVDDMRVAIPKGQTQEDVLGFTQNALAKIGLKLNEQKTKLVINETKIHPDQFITRALFKAGILVHTKENGSIDQNTLSEGDLLSFYHNIILPGLQNEDPEINTDLIRRTFQLLGYKKIHKFHSEVEAFIDAFPKHAYLTKYYYECGNYGQKHKDQIFDYAEKDHLNDFARYSFFTLASKHYIKKPEEFYERAQKWLADTSKPEYMRYFAAEICQAVEDRAKRNPNTQKLDREQGCSL